MGLITRSLAVGDSAPDYVARAAPKKGARRAHLRAYLGTIPDYAGSDAKGVALSGVAKKGPADKAGLKAGDVIVELAGRKIDNIYDYTYAIEALKIGEPVKVVVRRGEARMEFEVTPASRE
jgi:S1-C subfamily serine protease